MHAQGDDITWTREIPTMKVNGPDGYQYEPVWLNPAEAAARGITHGDIVKIFNERGIVLGGAYVTERLMPGVAYMDHGARWDPIIPGKLDRGGAINTITPHKVTSKNATGMVVSGFLVEVAKVTDEEMAGWRQRLSGGLRRGTTTPRPACRCPAGCRNRKETTMAKAFVIDVARCCGCYNCQLACKDEHVDNDWTPYAKPQPETGQFWMKVQENVCGTIPKVKMHYIPMLCNHCDEAGVHRRLSGRRHLEAGRRPGAHRAGEVHRLQGLRGRLPLRRHLLQRRAEPRAEVHRLRPSARQRLQAAPLRRGLPDGRHEIRRGGGAEGSHRRRHRAQARDRHAARASTTGTSRASSSPARSTTRSRRKSSSAPAACSPPAARWWRPSPTPTATSGSRTWRSARTT